MLTGRLRTKVRIVTAAFCLLAAPLTFSQGTPTPSPLVTVSPEQLFNWAESNFASLFPPGAVTRTQADPGGLIHFRQYPGTGNNVGLQGDSILGLGNFTNGKVQFLGSLSTYACQIVPNMCIFASSGTAKYLQWERLITPQSFCTVVQYQGVVYCSAFRSNGGGWTAVSAPPPSLSRSNSGRTYYSTPDYSAYVDTKSGKSLKSSTGIWGWDGESTAVRAQSGSRNFELSVNGGNTWTPLPGYAIGTLSDNSTRIVDKLAYAHGSIVAVINHYAPASISVEYRYLLVSPDAGQTWFTSGRLSKVLDLYLTGAAQGYVSTEDGVYAMRFANSIVLDAIPFEGGGSPDITRFYFVGPARETLFAGSTSSGFYLLNAITGTFYQPNPEWSGVSYLNYVDNGANGIVVVGRGSTTYTTPYPLVLREAP